MKELPLFLCWFLCTFPNKADLDNNSMRMPDLKTLRSQSFVLLIWQNILGNIVATVGQIPRRSYTCDLRKGKWNGHKNRVIRRQVLKLLILMHSIFRCVSGCVT